MMYYMKMEKNIQLLYVYKERLPSKKRSTDGFLCSNWQSISISLQIKKQDVEANQEQKKNIKPQLLSHTNLSVKSICFKS